MKKRYIVGTTDPTGEHFGLGVVFPLLESPMAEYEIKEEAVIKLKSMKEKGRTDTDLVYVILDRKTGEIIT